jgi:hypothetical protein
VRVSICIFIHGKESIDHSSGKEASLPNKTLTNTRILPHKNGPKMLTYGTGHKAQHIRPTADMHKFT